MEPRVIIYHKNCSDGFASAYVAKKALPDAIMIEAAYGDEIPATKDSTVYLLDFTYSATQMQRLIDNNRSVVVIDHHKTAMEALKDLRGNWSGIFDMTHSGAYLTWTYFNATEPPDIIKYVEDRDLWNWKLPMSKEINSAIRSYKQDIATWDILFAMPIVHLEEQGCAIEKYRDNAIRMAASKYTMATVSGHRVPVINCTNGEIVSEVLHELAKDHEFAVAYSIFNKDFKFSLRSIGDFDVSAIAKKHGGGGHRNAAGFVTNLEKGCWLICEGEI